MEPITLTLAPRSVSVSPDTEPAYRAGLGSGSSKWIALLINVTDYSCAFPAVTCETVCC